MKKPEGRTATMPKQTEESFVPLDKLPGVEEMGPPNRWNSDFEGSPRKPLPQPVKNEEPEQKE
jgi:hypothetical protein